MNSLFDTEDEVEPSRDVGRSSRTPIKHAILNKTVGKMVGAMCNRVSSVPARLPVLLVDACAGDGVDYAGEASSPTLMLKHHQFPRLLGQSFLLLNEKADAQYDSLLRKFGGLERVTVRRGDAHDIDLRLHMQNRGQAVFVHYDPNSIRDVPELARSVLWHSTPDTALMFITLGCNVGGLKRLAQDRREEWFSIIDVLVRALPRRHDLIIAALNNDASQWAYLLRVPDAWSATTMKALSSDHVAGRWEHGIRAYSFRRQQSDFVGTINWLFRTRKELCNEQA